MYRRAALGVSRRHAPQWSCSARISSTLNCRRSFRSSLTRLDETDEKKSKWGAARWGTKATVKPVGLSAAEKSLRESMVAKRQQQPQKQSEQSPPKLEGQRRPQQAPRNATRNQPAAFQSGRPSGQTWADTRNKSSEQQDNRPRTQQGLGNASKRQPGTSQPSRSSGRTWAETKNNDQQRRRDHEDRRSYERGAPRRERQDGTTRRTTEAYPTSGKQRHPQDIAKFQKLGESVLTDWGQEVPRRHGAASTTESTAHGKRKTQGAEGSAKDAKKEKQADPWAWDMSALEQLETIEAQNEASSNDAKRKNLRKQRQIEATDRDFDVDEHQRRRDERKRLKKERSLVKEKKKSAPQPLYLPQFISVNNLADVIGVRPAQFVQRMEEMGFEDVTYNHVLDAETAGLVATEFNFDPIFEASGDYDLQAAPVPEDQSALPTRPPVVTIMGHVDHGKTTILDWLRKSSVAASEHGGITQHIGAFSVAMPSGKTITFLDTPGHSAFLEMRRRGADVTDIVVLVVAADDSVKPQTIEAIKHATQAKVPIIVAISKIDKEGRNLDKVKGDLSAHGVHVEDYGGDVQAIGVSGKTGQGMVELEEAIGALSEMLDHRADTGGNVEGWVIEATTKSYGRVASALVRRGTLRPGDVIVAGTTWARVRTLRNEAGVAIDEATPGMPVEIDGWREQPAAGTEILQAPDEQKAKDVVSYRLEKSETQKLGEDMAAINESRRELMQKRKMEDGEDQARAGLEESSGPKAVNFIVKADVDGSAEAVLNSIAAIGNNEVYANVLRSGVGPVGEFDIEHAASANGKVISFNLPIDGNTLRNAESQGVAIMDHNIIYKLIDDIKATLSEHLKPTVTQRVTGEAEVQQVFEITVKGREKVPIAGCRVRNGLVNRTRKVRVMRGDQTIYDGTITSLKNVKKDVTEMRKDTECGIGFEDWTDFAVGDHIQCYEEIYEKRYL
ncbi:hypothetical protein N7474_004292 [Penicillium riverlandense]|uniref:uncharacterized protein n=1 Tax=Penicillium riverlandense TaxID=1903569 RepID=UPI002546DB2D|nr:uncharacterized protein N7474_004292 [Penicillium riverlandense]KAJ5818701.1 hypothetical protein N7474_004292 [Penicillium riverlandense]